MAGRTPKPPEERRTIASALKIRLTEAERAAIDEAARIAYGDKVLPGGGVTSAWARDTLLRAAKRVRSGD